MPSPKPHTTPEKTTMIPDMNDHPDHLESCLAKTQDLMQDTINNLGISSDLLDEHDKWFRKMKIDGGPEQYLEWYNAWMDTRHADYSMYSTSTAV